MSIPILLRVDAHEGERRSSLALPFFYKVNMPPSNNRVVEGARYPVWRNAMKVTVTEMLDFPPEIIFAVLTDIPHHTDWLEEPVELVSLIDGPAKLGTKWEQNSKPLGKKLVTINTCNLYEMNRKFGWKSEKPFLAQVTFLLESNGGKTKLTWIVESEKAGIVQLAEPLLVKQTQEMVRKSLIGLKTYLQAQAERK